MAAYKKSNSGFLPFIQKEEITAPFTSIQNRAKVDASLKCITGTERIHCTSVNRLVAERGPNGEPVFEVDNRDSRIRFYGNITSIFNTNGTHPTIGPDKSAEITFYGTGVNLLQVIHATTIQFDVEIDGVAAFTFSSAGYATLINNRSYNPRQLTSLASGLSLGWHTVKLTGVADATAIEGFDVINDASQILVKAGKAHGNGYEYILESDELIDYNLGFDNLADLDVGVRGGRSIIYMDPSDGSIKKRFTKTEATTLFLLNTDHSNEAPCRELNFREFGRNRSDDFSTLSSQRDAAFTLDDGTTTLVGRLAQVVAIGSQEGVDISTSGDSLTLTFVGTGLDIIALHNNTGNEPNPPTIYVDGIMVGTLGATGAGSGNSVRESICSGLPYGTHTVQIIQNGATLTGWSRFYQDFIVYQPKKPDLPEGAIELADYNLMADFVAGTTAGLGTMATGVLRKFASRENVYIDTTWNADFITGSATLNYIGGIQVFEASGNTTAIAQRQFNGTGFELRFRSFAAYNASARIRLNGVLLTAANFPTATFSSYGLDTGFDSANGTLDFRSAAQNIGAGFRVSGLPSGEYTFEMDKNGSGATMSMEAFDIITPIHSYHTTFGSRSLKDCRNFDATKDVNKTVKRNDRVFVSVNDSPTQIFKSKGVSQVLNTSTGFYNVYYEESYSELSLIKGSALRGGKVFATVGTLNRKNHARVQLESVGGAQENTPFDAQFKGKLERDELEE